MKQSLFAALPERLQRWIHAYRLSHRMADALGYVPNFDQPQTYNEKMAWRILYDHNPLFPKTIDKIEARDYVARRIGKKYLVPLVATWERAADISWGLLPNQFVLKASHGWNMNIFVHDRNSHDRVEALATVTKWMNYNHYIPTGEWGYKNIPPRLMAEHLLQNLIEMKFHVFNGHARDYWGKPFKTSSTPMEAVENLADRLENCVRGGGGNAIEADAIRHHLRELVRMLMERDVY